MNSIAERRHSGSNCKATKRSSACGSLGTRSANTKPNGKPCPRRRWLRDSIPSGSGDWKPKSANSTGSEKPSSRKSANSANNGIPREIKRAGRQLAAEMRGFLHQRDWVAKIERDVETANARVRELKTEFEARQQALGPDWPVHRLSAIDTSRAAYVRLVDGAKAFQSAQARQSSLRKRYEKFAAACHQQQAEWDQQIETLPESSLDEALDKTRQQLVQAEELARLKQQESELRATPR